MPASFAGSAARSVCRPSAFCAIVAAGFCLCSSFLTAQNPAAQPPVVTSPKPTVEDWTVTVGKSLVVDSPLTIERISVADGALADAVGVGPREVLINGKAPGETSVIVWQSGGSRLLYNLSVRPSSARVDAVRQQIALEFPEDDVSIVFDNDTAFVRGTVKDVVDAARVAAIASSLGRVVNLLHVEVPPVEAQIMVKVRFCDVDRSASRALAVNLASGAFNQSTALGTGMPLSTTGSQPPYSLSDAVNIFLFRNDINLAAAIQALASKSLLETLAEPSVPAINGKSASFLAGGQFPFPVVQPGSNGGAATITISWREYGVRLNFLPLITPRGTIRLQVAPEVSALDYTNAITIAGTTVPALSTRKVQTEIELESGQSFVIAGLLDNQTTDNFSKVPGIGDIPILGKLFQSKTVSRSNSELLVIVTPEIVRPIPASQPAPALNFPQTFMPANSTGPIRQPGMDVTGPVPVTPPSETVRFEQLLQMLKQGQPDTAPNAPGLSNLDLPQASPSTTGSWNAAPSQATPSTAGGTGR
jgi:pilus assembly protein CpaC